MDLTHREILTGNGPIGRYPLHLLKRVDQPTTKYVGKIERRRPEQDAFHRAAAGEYGEKIAERAKVFHGREPLLVSLGAMQHQIAMFELPPVANKKAPIPDDPHILARHIKALGHFLGADMVGICKLPQSALYLNDEYGKPIDLDLKNAIVLLNVKHKETVRASYGREWIDDPASFAVYQRCAAQAQVMTHYIRSLGWPAESSCFFRYLTLMPELVIESGLGEGSRIGIALNPFVGSSFKVSAVLTDLPLEADRPIDFGLQDYCANCRICAEQCATNAIPKGEKEVYNGYETWHLNYRNCVSGVMTNKYGNVCQRCTKVCPWNRPDNRPEDFKDWDGDPKFLYDSVKRQAERICANGYKEPEELTDKWWFPLECTPDGIVEAPDIPYN